jgi:hypothetical protein
MVFLQCLKEAIIKYTTVEPKSQVREVFLRDKFLIQSSPENFKSWWLRARKH